MSDFYRDTDDRMMHDVDFRAAVHYMMGMARAHGFTTGELKQIAFRAALELEMRRPPTQTGIETKIDGARGAKMDL